MEQVYTRSGELGKGEELTVTFRGETFVLVPYEQRVFLAGSLVEQTAYEVLTKDYLPARHAFGLVRGPATPVVGNIEQVKASGRAYGRKSAGWASPQIRMAAVDSPEEAAKKLLGWLERRARKAVAS